MQQSHLRLETEFKHREKQAIEQQQQLPKRYRQHRSKKQGIKAKNNGVSNNCVVFDGRHGEQAQIQSEERQPRCRHYAQRAVECGSLG